MRAVLVQRVPRQARCAALSLLIALWVSIAPNGLPAQQHPATGIQASPSIQRLATQHLPNAVRVHARVVSGGLPQGELAFAELRALGFRTIISVDGARPDVALARRFGLRYVHLPHGYDGISPERGAELAKAVRDLPGPIYLHCHHGKHRSPAAAAVACIGAGMVSSADAARLLRVAGTDPKYLGLFAAVAGATPWTAGQLDALDVEFREVAPIAPLAEAMVAIEHLHDRLTSLSTLGWKSPDHDPQHTASHAAVLLAEHFREIERLEDFSTRPAGFQYSVRTSQQASAQLEAILVAWDRGRSTEAALTGAGDALLRITQDCAGCHRHFRDVPLTK